MIAAFLTGLLTPVLTPLLAASAPYAEVAIDDIYVGSVNPLNGKPSVNFKQIDINRDKQTDLVFPGYILLQKNGSFSQSAPIDMPEANFGPHVDFFNDVVFLRFPEGLKTYRYLDNGWELQLDTEIAWPQHRASNRRASEQPFPPSFERYVYDINDDGTPELIFPMQGGLHLYSFADDTYIPHPPLHLLPKSRLIPPDTVTPASNQARYLTFPNQHIAFHAALENDLLTILSKEALGDSSIRFSTTRYQIVMKNGQFGFNPAVTSRQTPLYESYIQPCRLNPDDEIDFAGGTLDYAASLAILTPIFTTKVFSTPDAPPQTFRAKSFTPHTLFTDYNHDGFSDLIQESTRITDGGLRETLNRFTTQKKFQHTVHVHLQQQDHRFSTAPDISKTITIKLDQTPIRLSEMFQRYQAGKLLNLTGDFNGDDRNDLLVQTSERELSLYFAQEDSFPKTPDHTIPIEPHETFHVLDLNQDGISDILLQGSPDDDLEADTTTRALLFAKEDSP